MKGRHRATKDRKPIDMCVNYTIYPVQPANPAPVYYPYTFTTNSTTYCSYFAISERLDQLMATVQDVVDSFNTYKSSVDAKLDGLKTSVDSLSQDSAALDALKAQVDAASAALNPAPVEG